MANQRKIGALMSYFALFIQMAVNLIYTPLMLRLLGQSEYGVYQLVVSTVGYLNLLSLGFNASYIRFYSKYKAEDDFKGIASLNGMFMLIFSIISVVCALVGTAMVLNLKLIFATGLSAQEIETAKPLMALLVVNLVITFPSSVFDCYVTAHEKFIFQKLLIVLQQVFNPIIAIPFLLLGYGSVAIVIITTALSFVKLCVNAYYCIRKLKMRFDFKNIKFSLFKEMGAFTFFIFLNQIIDQVNWNVDKFLLGRYLGTAAVAVYGVASTVSTLYMHLSTAVSNVFVPKINRIVAEEDDNKQLTQMFSSIGRIQFILLAMIVSCFAFFGKTFVQLWAGSQYVEAYYVVLILIIPLTIPLIQNIGIEIQRAKNKHKTRSVVYFFIAVGNVALSIPLIKTFGVIGATIGTAFSYILGNGLFMNWYYHKRIGIDVIYFWKNIVKLLPALIIPTASGVVIALFFNISGWIQLIICGIAFVIIYAISMFLYGLNRYEKKLVASFFKRFKKHEE